MPKANNTVGSETIRVTVSEQSKRLLEQLAKRGIHGRNAAEVAGRFVDEALQRFVEEPKLQLETERSSGRHKLPRPPTK
jgi:hypothetical protein